MIVNIIAAYCKNGGLGKNNKLLWNIKSDMAKFKKLTIGNGNNAIIMGRKTFESLNKVKGLINRDNLILSKSLKIDEYNGENCVKSFATLEQLDDYVKTKNYSELWVIGGAEIYELFLNNYKKQENCIFNISEIIITYIDTDYDCDCYFPNLNIYIDKYNLLFYSKNIINKNDKNDKNDINDKNDKNDINNNNDLSLKQSYNSYEIIYKFI
jgi:dihydrofolate reductase